MASPASEDLRQAFERARDLDGSMAERLDAFADAMRRHDPAFASAVDTWVDRLRRYDAGRAAPKPGDSMPPFVLPDESGHLVSLRELLAQGPAVVTFHRGHWCPYCRISINTLAKAQARIAAVGAGMVAIVPERSPFAAELKLDSGARFPVLSDIDNGYALTLNLAVRVDADMKEQITRLGRLLPRYQGNDSWMLPIPATFVVDPDGRIRARFVDPDYRRRMAVEELIDSLK